MPSLSIIVIFNFLLVVVACLEILLAFLQTLGINVCRSVNAYLYSIILIVYKV